ncbi:response regulator, partial [Pseudomonas fluorescens]
QALQLADENEPDGLGTSAVIVPSVLKTLHVLAVEDHPINQLVLTEQLQQLGCQVTMASDGREALQRWQRGEHFDMVVTDVNMPELDGYQLTRRLRAEGIKVPIVGVTANAQAEEGERCVQAGMDGYLAKPVSLARLREALQAVGVSVAGVSKVNVIAKLDEINPAMRDLFVSTTRHDWAAMMNSLSEGNATAVTQYAHRLKGALVTIGAMDAADFCSHLEEIAASGHLSRIDECLSSLKEYLDPILEASS